MFERAKTRKDELLEKHFLRKLTPEESREFDRLCLEDDELFELMAIEGTIDEHRRDPRIEQALSAAPPRTAWTGLRWAAALAAVACPGALLFWYMGRDTNLVNVVLERPRQAPAAAPKLEEPIILARHMPAAELEASFRGQPAPAPPPASRPLPTAAEDGEVNVPFGSQDGVAQGARLEVRRDGRLAGMIEVGGAVFLNHARGRVIEGEVQPGDQIHVPPAMRLRAIWDRVDALIRTRDLDAARRLIREGTEMRGLGQAPKRQGRLKLAVLAWASGNLEAAFRQADEAAAAIDDSTTRPERLAIWETLAALSLQRADLSAAGSALREAERAGPGAEVWNNLGVISEKHGDLEDARQYYERALQSPGLSEREKLVIERNLARKGMTR